MGTTKSKNSKYRNRTRPIIPSDLVTTSSYVTSGGDATSSISTELKNSLSNYTHVFTNQVRMKYEGKANNTTVFKNSLPANDSSMTTKAIQSSLNQNRNNSDDIMRAASSRLFNGLSNHKQINHQLEQSDKQDVAYSFRNLRRVLNSSLKEHRRSVPENLDVVAHSYRLVDDAFRKGRNVVALYDYNSNGAEDLAFKKGDHLLVIDDRHKDWWFARHIRTHESGYIPQRYVSEIDNLKTKEWFFEGVTLRDAERLLDQPFNCSGTYLIRPSGSIPGNYALSILDVHSNDQTQVKHYRIQLSVDGRFFIGPKADFATINDLVDYYTAKSEGLCTKLDKPCPKHKPALRDLSYNDLNKIEIDRNSIKLISLIGSGNYGEVWKGKCRSLDVAVKTMKSRRQPSSHDFLDEARLMKDLDHPNIVRLYGVSTSAEPLYIVVEYMVNGNLLTYLRSDMGRILKLPKLVDVAAQIASGMSYLEKQHFVHCDLAARNILVGEAMLVKIGDFGLAKIIRTGKLLVESQTQFPIKWTAPEAATKKEYTIKSDVWSFGILLYELITRGSIPYPGMSNQETLKAVSEGFRLSKPPQCPNSFYHVMTNCWNANPKLRPTFEHLYNLFDDYFVTMEPNYKESDDF
ncbi:hypothetical protein GJ496_000103 [Pomphorhynchus laevis]|nr:hypothetical protein GJ496_000103 [Pomphorhynchus laevis]